MSESRISSKGQITIPKAIRMRMHWEVGDRLRFVVETDGSVAQPPPGRVIPDASL
jgi:AbrB family looped-hinge helix DNA binding protein